MTHDEAKTTFTRSNFVSELMHEIYDTDISDSFTGKTVHRKNSATRFVVEEFDGNDFVLRDKANNTLTLVDWESFQDEYLDERPTLYADHQATEIKEGIWSATYPADRLSKVNALIEKLAEAEPVDFHPGTGEVVRDIVHPSLYPLIIDPASVTGSNFWGREYEPSRFQWLPTETQVDDCQCVKFTSAINNLDVTKYPELVKELEEVLSALLPGLEHVWQYAQTITFSDEYQEDKLDYPEARKTKFENLQVVVKIADYIFKPGTSFNGVWHYDHAS